MDCQLTTRSMSSVQGSGPSHSHFALRVKILMPGLMLCSLLTLAAPFATAQSKQRFPEPPQHKAGAAKPVAHKNQPHLPEWFRNHQNLTPQQQMQALQSEPGFSKLPPQVQARLLMRLDQLNAMPPARRERMLQHMEALEKLSPDQRQQIGRMMLQLDMLPADHQRRMREAFRFLRDLPPDQRQVLLASAAFKNQFSDQENEILSKLMTLEPYVPPSQAGK